MTKKEQSSDTSFWPQLEIYNRVKNLPTVFWATNTTTSTWSYVKSLHPSISFIFGLGETRLNREITDAASIAKPVVQCFEKEIRIADRKLCEGLDAIETKVPIVKAPPQQIYDAAKVTVISYYSWLFGR